MEENNFMMVAINMDDMKVLIIGGGNIAYKKAVKLVNYNTPITILAPQLDERFKDLDVNFINDLYNISYLDNFNLVIAATDKDDLNLEIYQDCKARNILCNNITSQKDMSLKMAATFEYEDYLLAITGKHGVKDTVKMKNKFKEFINNDKH